ncbi:MAG: acylneuraminate cytidylyltransferase family protein [Chitinophagaceae bacterium]|nr:acylneuraminate cytidylyltransferase family protein [Chitinophagaceae bacterium]
MKTVAFIFARGGSKGLPGKNIRLLEGKPLIAWSIEHAFAVKKIDRVVVSTDSEEIAETARNYGAEVPFIRPSYLAEDDTPEWLAWRHALNYLMETSGSLPDIMVSLPVTAPLRLPIDIDNCLYEYEKGAVDAVITATDAHRNPFFNMVKLNEDGFVSLVNSSESGIARRQDVPIVYDMTTVCYVLSPEFVMNHNSLFEGKVKMIHVPAERAIDIDTLLDFHIAESILCLRRK